MEEINLDPKKTFSFDLNGKLSFEGTKKITYDDLVLTIKDIIKPVVGDVIKATLARPLCCKVGNTFDVEWGELEFITCRLLEVLDDVPNVNIEIVSITELTHYVQPATKEQKAFFDKTHVYLFTKPEGYHEYGNFHRVKDDVFFFIFNSECDNSYEEWIYTDAEGFDHQVRRECWDLANQYYTESWGDRLIGYHSDGPWEKFESCTESEEDLYTRLYEQLEYGR